MTNKDLRAAIKAANEESAPGGAFAMSIADYRSFLNGLVDKGIVEASHRDELLKALDEALKSDSTEPVQFASNSYVETFIDDDEDL